MGYGEGFLRSPGPRHRKRGIEGGCKFRTQRIKLLCEGTEMLVVEVRAGGLS